MKNDIIKLIENSMGTRFYLRDAWNVFKTKDPVDAYSDALALVEACRQRLHTIDTQNCKPY